MKALILQVGYCDYEIGEVDAVALLGIAQRMKKVSRIGYGSTYSRDAENEPFCTVIQVCEIVDAEPKPDKFGQATRDATEVPF